jgi:hypothetical protein
VGPATLVTAELPQAMAAHAAAAAALNSRGRRVILTPRTFQAAVQRE